MDLSNETGNIAKAFVAAQADLTPVAKDKSGYGYKYADLATVDGAARKAIKTHGLAITQTFEPSDARTVINVRTTLWHESGEYISGVLSIPIPEMKQNNAAQQAGSAITYARRYSLAAMLGIVTADDDAACFQKPKVLQGEAKQWLEDADSLQTLKAAWEDVVREGFKQQLEGYKDKRKQELS